MISQPPPPPQARVSWSASVVTMLLWLMRRRQVFVSADHLMEGIVDCRRRGPARPTKRMQAELDVQLETIAGCEVYTLRPREPSQHARVALYLHGGAYCRPITSHHWTFVRWLSKELGYTVVVPLYPLAPEAQCAEAVQAVRDVHAAVLDRHGAIDVLMGDSAGGGLCLALCQVLRDAGHALPHRMVLITPWVDVRLTHPHIPATEPRDPMLAVDGLREAGRLYAGGLGRIHPLVSPLNADMVGLPPMMIVVGTDDILGHDATLFAAAAARSGCRVQTVVGERMVHVWPLLPIAEARSCKSTIRDFIHEVDTNS